MFKIFKPDYWSQTSLAYDDKHSHKIKNWLEYFKMFNTHSLFPLLWNHSVSSYTVGGRSK